MITSIWNPSDDDGENIVSKDLVKEVPGCENYNADNVKEWLISDKMIKITKFTVVELIEDEKECNYAE